MKHTYIKVNGITEWILFPHVSTITCFTQNFFYSDKIFDRLRAVSLKKDKYEESDERSEDSHKNF